MALPVVNSPQFRNSPTAGTLNVDFSTAQRYVNQLEAAGLLAEITGHALADLRRPTPTPSLIGF